MDSTPLTPQNFVVIDHADELKHTTFGNKRENSYAQIYIYKMHAHKETWVELFFFSNRSTGQASILSRRLDSFFKVQLKCEPICEVFFCMINHCFFCILTAFYKYLYWITWYKNYYLENVQILTSRLLPTQMCINKWTDKPIWYNHAISTTQQWKGTNY